MAPNLFTFGASTLALMGDANQVITTRLLRLSAPGAWSSPQGMREMQRMVSEKQDAMLEAWWTMAFEGMALYQQAAFGLLLGKALPLPGDPRLLRGLQSGLRPFRSRVTANRRRLGRR